MEPNVVLAHGITAHSALVAILSVAESVFGNDNLHLVFKASFPVLNVDIRGTTSELANHDSVKNVLNALDGDLSVWCTRAEVSRVKEPNHKINFSADDSLAGKIEVAVGNDIGKTMNALQVVRSRFKPKELSIESEKSARHEMIQAVRFREQALSDLSEHVARLGSLVADVAVKQEAHTRDLTSRLETEFIEKQSRLEKQFEARRKELDAQFGLREEQLNERERQFDDKVRHFELNEAKYVRRKLLDTIKETIEASREVSLSRGTSKKRNMVVAGFLVAAFAFGTLAVFAAMNMLKAQEFNWPSLSLWWAGIIGFASTLIFYIRWSDNWARSHAVAEFAIKQFESDILRASWLAELVSEWQTERELPMPEVLIRSFARNLFEAQSNEQARHPLEDLTAFVGNIHSIRASKKGTDLVFKDNKAL